MPLPTAKSEPVVDPGRLIVTIHGMSGIGKSTFCSRAEDVIFLACEPGLNAIRAYKYEPEPGRHLLESWGELWLAYKELREDTSRRFRTVCIDTGNAAFKMCQAYICGKHGVQHETDIPGNAKGYTLINNEFARLIKAFTGLRMGLYIACHSRDVTMKTKTQEWIKQAPDFPDKARGMLISLSDFVLFADVEEYEDEKDEGKKKVRRVIHSTPTALYEAKYRFKPLPDPIPLSYGKFIEEFKKANSGGQGQETGANIANVANVANAGTVASPPKAEQPTTAKPEPVEPPKQGQAAQKEGQKEAQKEPVKADTKPDTKPTQTTQSNATTAKK
jgi:hypothetical protein